MRISSSQLFQQGLGSIIDNQSRLARAQLEISSGKKLLTSSDNPVAAVRSVELNTAISRSEQYMENGSYARSRLSAQEFAVSGSLTSLQRVHELALQANNATQNNETRGILAKEMREQLANLLQLANSSDADGRYIFSGFQQEARPFSFSGGAVQYHGDDGRRELQLGPNRTLVDADPGSAVFAGIALGNGLFAARAASGNTGSVVIDAGSVTEHGLWGGEPYRIRFSSADSYEVLDDSNAVVSTGAYRSGDSVTVAGLTVTLSGEAAVGDEFSLTAPPRGDVFTIVDRLAAALEQPRNNPAERAAQTNEINASLTDINQVIDHLVGVQTSIGTRLNVVDQQEDINSGAVLQLRETLSGLVDVDIVEASSRFSQALVSLQASQQAFARVQQLSLFNFL